MKGTAGRRLSTSLIIAGVSLIIVNCIGMWWPGFPYSKYNITTGIPGYHFPTMDKDVLLDLLQNKADTNVVTFLADVTNTVYYGTYHTENRKASLFENWILWLPAKFYAPFGRTQDAAMVVKGRAGNCSERVQVLMEIYKRNGIDAQVLLLNGHVALQTFFRGQWTITDPDFGLIRPGNIDSMRTREGLSYADSFLLARGFNQKVRDYYLYAWRVTSDDKILQLNRHPNFRLYYIEKISLWLCWFVPAICIIIGLIVQNKKIATAGPLFGLKLKA